MKASGAVALLFWAVLSFCPVALIAQPPTGPVLPWSSESTGRAPKLDLIQDYACTTCSDDGSPGLIPSIRSLAVGPYSFAVLFQKAPTVQLVRVWRLDSGAVTQFSATPDTTVRSPFGITLLRDSVVVAGNGRLQLLGRNGTLLGTNVLSDEATLRGTRRYTSSPSGRWILFPEQPLMDAPSLRRFDRQSGESELLDVPLQLAAGSTSSSPTSAQNLSAVTIGDDGTVAMGNGSTAYRLLLLPANSGARLEGGRSIPMPSLSPQQIESLRKRSPQDAEQRIQAGAGHFASDALQFDALGRLWVRTSRRINETPALTVFDVFSAKLEFLGDVTVNGLVGEFHVGDGLLVGVTRNGQSTSNVKVWKISEP